MVITAELNGTLANGCEMTQADVSLPEVTKEGCTHCGKTKFLLAEDITDYSSYEHDAGHWVYGYKNSQKSGAEKSVRFYCAACGTDHKVPEGIVS